jgi:large subunit ribosomal protein L24
MEKSYSPLWKSSAQRRKQRKYRYNAPLHVKQRFVHAHLSRELAKKYGRRSIQLKTGDKVKICRGTSKKKEGKVERIDLKRERVYVTGIERIKKEGSKVMIPLNPSNLVIVDVVLDKKRKEKLEGKKSEEKSEKKSAQRNAKEGMKEEAKGKDKKRQNVSEQNERKTQPATADTSSSQKTTEGETKQ